MTFGGKAFGRLLCLCVVALIALLLLTPPAHPAPLFVPAPVMIVEYLADMRHHDRILDATRIKRLRHRQRIMGDRLYHKRIRADIVRFARRCLGAPYVWGGTSPHGFDCSGLVQCVFRLAGLHLPRRATEQQRATVRIPLRHLLPGDLVFFGGVWFSHHVAIYIGHGHVIEAPHSGALVRYGQLWGRDAWTGGRTHQ